MCNEFTNTENAGIVRQGRCVGISEMCNEYTNTTGLNDVRPFSVADIEKRSEENKARDEARDRLIRTIMETSLRTGIPAEVLLDRALEEAGIENPFDKNGCLRT